jgi:hypothetical protein
MEDIAVIVRSDVATDTTTGDPYFSRDGEVRIRLASDDGSPLHIACESRPAVLDFG